MHRRLGFTVVEVVVVAVLLTILLVTSVIGLRGSQVSSRDRERRADISTLHTNLETLYNKEIRSGSTIIKPQGSYMPVQGNYLVGLSISPEMIKELDELATRAPNQSAISLRTVPGSICNTSGSPVSTTNICYINSTSLNNELTAAKVTTNNYVYVPLVSSADNRLCTVSLIVNSLAGGCRSFKLYSVLETDSSLVQIKESIRK